MRRKVSWLVVMLCVSVLIGCQSTSIQHRPYYFMGEDPVILVHDLEGGMDMQILGTVEYDKDSKCLHLKSTHADDPGFSTPIWPKGTTPVMDKNRRGVNVPGYGIFLEGDTIDVGGGGIERSALSHLDVPRGCLETDGAVAINKSD